MVGAVDLRFIRQLSDATLDVCEALRYTEPKHSMNIASEMGLSRSYINRRIRDLIDRGLVKQVPLLNHQRPRGSDVDVGYILDKRVGRNAYIAEKERRDRKGRTVPDPAPEHQALNSDALEAVTAKTESKPPKLDKSTLPVIVVRDVYDPDVHQFRRAGVTTDSAIAYNGVLARHLRSVGQDPRALDGFIPPLYVRAGIQWHMRSFQAELESALLEPLNVFRAPEAPRTKINPLVLYHNGVDRILEMNGRGLNGDSPCEPYDFNAGATMHRVALDAKVKALDNWMRETRPCVI